MAASVGAGTVDAGLDGILKGRGRVPGGSHCRRKRSGV